MTLITVLAQSSERVKDKLDDEWLQVCAAVSGTSCAIAPFALATTSYFDSFPSPLIVSAAGKGQTHAPALLHTWTEFALNCESQIRGLWRRISIRLPKCKRKLTKWPKIIESISEQHEGECLTVVMGPLVVGSSSRHWRTGLSRASPIESFDCQ